MAEPVPHHELHPAGRQQVDRGRRLELLTRQQFQAHGARVGREDGWLRFGIGVRDGHVATKARTSHPHSWVLQIVMRAIRRPCRQITCLHRFNDRLVDSRLLGRIVQIVLPQDVAQPQQDEQSQRRRHFIPSDGVIQGLCNLVINAPERRLAIARLGRLAGGHLLGGKPSAQHQRELCLLRVPPVPEIATVHAVLISSSSPFAFTPFCLDVVVPGWPGPC